VVSWISQGAAGLATGSQGVVGYPRDGTGATEAGAAGQPGRERKASGRCEVPRGLRDVMVCRVMSRDVGKGLDPKRDEQKMSCTAGDEVCRGRRDVPREMSYTVGDKSCRGRQDVPRETRHTVEGGSEAEGTVKQSGVRGFPLHPWAGSITPFSPRASKASLTTSSIGRLRSDSNSIPADCAIIR